MEDSGPQGELRPLLDHRTASQTSDAPIRQPGAGGDQPGVPTPYRAFQDPRHIQLVAKAVRRAYQRLRLLQLAVQRCADPHVLGNRASDAQVADEYCRNALEGRVPSQVRRERGPMEEAGPGYAARPRAAGG